MKINREIYFMMKEGFCQKGLLYRLHKLNKALNLLFFQIKKHLNLDKIFMNIILKIYKKN